MSKNDLKKSQHRSPRNPKTSTEVPTSRIVVFKAPASLKQRINRYNLETIRGYFRSGH
jgi:nucleoid DNA-binding protein